jgi:uncharacterized protein YecE (DUF72 family)
MSAADPRVRIGTAGWSIPRASAEAFAGEGSHLERLARVLGCAEINSAFYREHRRETYERWARAVPRDFRFAVKLPRTVTHELALRGVRRPLETFASQVSGLGRHLAVLLVQLPPSLAFEARLARAFFASLAQLSDAAIVCEPRHASWFEPRADALLARWQVGRAAADPARHTGADRPGGWLGPAGDGAGAVVYHRWHGSPRMYWSAYDDAWLDARAAELTAWPRRARCWCVFDNTASGAAADDALRLAARLSRRAASA